MAGGMSAAGGHVEIERKFDADLTFPLPEFLDLPGVATLEQPVEQHLEATYFDTVELRLLRHATTLRRRTGGADDGWHLKLPKAADERLEVHRPLGRSVRTPPKALTDLARVHIRDQELLPVASLVTRRTVHRLLDEKGEVLAEVADDHVAGKPLDADGGTWREVEVELVGGDRELLDAVGAQLRRAGCSPATTSSKLHRVLRDRMAPEHKPVELSRKSPAGDVALAHLREQSAALMAWDPYTRTNEPDAVHKMRVSTRRLRSALATYRPLLDVAVTEPLRAELKWLGGVLGEARDAEVIHERLNRLVSEQPPELLLGPVRRRIDLEMRQRHRAALATIRAELKSERYFRLLDSLDGLDGTALSAESKAKRKASAVLPRLVAKTRRRVLQAAELAQSAESAEQVDRQLHEVRKAAKRARYAAESVAAVFGAPADSLAAEMEDLQEILGRQQDGAASREVLRQLGAQAHLAGENGFSFGLLHGLDRRSGDDRYHTVMQAVQDEPAWLR
ncbi:MAG: CHAD domain-containing protein [Geodermatophilaceae bacterium]